MVLHHVRSIRVASDKLHGALNGAWCCNELAHFEHDLRLCLDAKARDGVCLNIAITCHERPTASNYE